MNLVKLEDDKDEKEVIEDNTTCEDEPKDEELLGCLPSCAKLGLTILAIATIGYGFYKLQDCEDDSSDDEVILD
jgi:hypothetical protein